MAKIDNRKPKEKLKEDLKKVVESKPEDTPEEPEETPEEPKEEPIEETPELEEPVEESPEELSVDYREKFTESTREAQVLTAKNKKLTEIIDKASELDEPTEEELRREYFDWEGLSEVEQKLAKDNLMNKKKFELVHQAVQETKKIDEWADKLDKFIEESSASGKYPELEGMEDTFRRFSMKPTRRGVDFEDLVKAFLFDVTPPAKNKGSLLETGTGGPKELKPKTLSVEDISKIRKADPKRYRSLIKEGKIRIEI